MTEVFKMPTKDNFFRADDGAVLYYEDCGSGDPIIFIPGFMCSTKFFRKNVGELSKTHRVITLDNRGHGYSSKTLDNVTIPQMAKDVKTLVDQLGLDNITLVPWSLANSIGLSYLEQFGSYKVKRIALLDSAFFPVSEHPSNSHYVHHHNVEALLDQVVMMQKDYYAFCKGFAQGIFKNPPPPEDEEWVVHELLKCPVYIAIATLTDFVFHDYMSFLPKINIPVMIAGVNGPVLPRGIEGAKAYVELLKVKYKLWEVEEVGHTMFYEDPERFHKELLDFIENY